MSKNGIVVVVAVIVAANAFAIYRALHSGDAFQAPVPKAAELPPAINPIAPSKGAAPEVLTDLTWPVIQKTKVASIVGESRVDFAPELQFNDNKLVRVSGVLFFLKEGIQDGKVKWCVMMPPSRYSCCGISCDPRQELMFYVDCSKNPWPNPEAKMMAVVKGRLRLRHDDSLWCLYSLEDAEVTPLPGGTL